MGNFLLNVLDGISGKSFVKSYANLAGFPTVGFSGYLYLDLATSSLYYWDGSTYQQTLSKAIEDLWGYQDFDAGVITSTSVTLTANENGAGAAFDPATFFNYASIYDQDGLDYVYSSGFLGMFSGIVKVTSQSGTSITLNKIPANTENCRIWYRYLGTMPSSGYTIPPQNILDAAGVITLGDEFFIQKMTTAPADTEVIVADGISGSKVKSSPVKIDSSGNVTSVNSLKANTSGGLSLYASNGTLIGDIGVGNTANNTWEGVQKLNNLTASSAVATDASKNLVSVTNTGSGNNVLATSPTLVTPILGTPTSGTLTNCTGLPISTGVSGLGTGVATFLATPSSANLAAAITDETGTGALVFGTSPTFTTQITTPTVIKTGATDTNFDYTANSSTALTLDPANGYSQGITLTANTTLTLASNPSSGTEREMVVDLIQDGTGGRTVAWSNVSWNNGVAPTISSTIGSVTRIGLKGTTRGWIGFANIASSDSVTFGQVNVSSAAGTTALTTQAQTSGAGYSSYIATVNTTDATVTTIYTITLPTDSNYTIRGLVRAQRTGGSSGTAGDGAGYSFFADVRNVGGTASLVSTADISSKENQAGWDLTIDASGATIRIRVTGAANNNVTWDLFLEQFGR